jgi:hypothetical protein
VLFGGLIAGGASVATTIVNQNGETARADRAAEQEVRGAARALISRFTTDLNYLGYALRIGAYPAYLPKFAVPLAKHDVELIDGRLPAEGFITLDIALRDTGEAFVEAGENPVERLESGIRREIVGLRTEVERARDALLPLAGLPPYPRRSTSGAAPGT